MIAARVCSPAGTARSTAPATGLWFEEGPNEAIVSIRTRRPPDICFGQIAELNTLEGLPVTAPDLQRRLEALRHGDRQLLAVGGESLIGYAHLHKGLDLVHDVSAGVVLLIVHPALRCRGIDRTLVAAVETWARQSDRARLLLRTDIVRTPAQAFFVALGYQQAATTREFVRDLSRAPVGRADHPTRPRPSALTAARIVAE